MLTLTVDDGNRGSEMSIRVIALILGTVVIGGCALFQGEPTADLEDDFETRVSRYFEDALEPLQSDGSLPAIVGSGGCQISDELRDEFNSLVPLSSAAQAAAEARHAKYGLPIDTIGGDLDILLHHDRYVIGYNSDLKTPVVASYFLNEDDIIEGGDRKTCFREDHRLDESERSRLIDYDFQITGFDRGHLVPDADLQATEADAINSYFMSNMMPQHKSFNRGVWRVLEAAVRLWADERDSVHVITGVIFDRDENGERDAEEDAERAPPTRNVAVATAFYKIIVNEQSDGSLDAIAFTLPHTFTSTAPNVDYITENIVSIDSIETVTGYDFFPELNDTLEDQLEAMVSPDLWCRRRCG